MFSCLVWSLSRFVLHGHCFAAAVEVVFATCDLRHEDGILAHALQIPRRPRRLNRPRFSLSIRRLAARKPCKGLGVLDLIASLPRVEDIGAFRNADSKSEPAAFDHCAKKSSILWRSALSSFYLETVGRDRN